MSGNVLARLAPILSALSLIVLATPVRAQDAPPSPPPGFRPASPYAAAFVESLPAATLVVLPTVVRTVEGTTTSPASQGLIVDFLDTRGLDVARANDGRIEFGAAPHAPQWEIFQGSLRTVSAAVDGRAEADYTVLMELVLPPGDRRVFGIQTYIVDREGRNAFSFLLNSHHEVFQEAALVAADGTEASREAMIAEATRVGVEALGSQIDWSRDCEAWMAAHPPEPASAGVIEDFETGLPALRDGEGVPLGFSTFSDGHSTVRTTATPNGPPREGEAAGNHTLRVDFHVSGWAGVVYLPHDPSARMWVSQDWTDVDGISFWMHGRETGAKFYVHVFDNRNPCSTRDDAERFGYEFTDDFSGWKQISIPFADMVRAEVGNDAPNDGFGRDRVHGWAFGATDTMGEGTWYLDDVALWRAGGS